MRANPSLYSSVDQAMQQSETVLQTALSQLSSGKRVDTPSDDPLAFALSTENIAQSASVDQYTKNSDALESQAQQADSALSSVITTLTQALSLGTQGGSPSITPAQRSSLADQVQATLQSVVAQANTSANGRALFAGTATTVTPFAIDTNDPTTVTYSGNQGSSQAVIGDGEQVTANVPGSEIFQSSSGDVFGSLQQVISALQTGSSENLASATNAVSSAIAHVSSIRAVYASIANQATSQSSFLAQETVTLSAQQSSLVDMDTATAATALTQAQTAHSAVLAAAAKILPESLLNYLRN